MDKEETIPRFTQAAKRQIYSTVALATVMMLIAAQPKAAFLLVVMILPLGIWFAWSIYVLISTPYARLAQAICMVIWAVAIGLVVLIHFIRHESARSDADEIVKAIAEETKAQKRCPQKLDNLVIQRPQLSERMRADFTYDCTGGKPRFFYSATFTVFDTYEYDFRARAWKYRSWLDKSAPKVSG